MPLLLLIAGVIVVAFLSLGGAKTVLRQSADDVLRTASGRVLTIQERADELTRPVVETVEEVDRRVDAVQQGLGKLREGADLLRQGVKGE